jgi:hypothetical protein
MTWVRFDDQFPIHRKVGGLSDVLYRLQTEAIFWCSRNATDGVIRASELTLVSVRAKPARAAELVSRDLWHGAEKLCPQCIASLSEAGTKLPPDGWVVHDYLLFQPSRAKVEKDRQAKAERQAKWLSAKKGGRRSRDASLDASKDAAPRDANPAPPRPEGSGAKPRGASRPLASQGGGRSADENPDWRTLPTPGSPRNAADVDRARRGAAAARELLARPPAEEAS